ncbi:hypothetical protein HMPREF9120_01815 [Neisseria sp. oral taxon 020 str. F0370]|nr:hypothetical protein HMPREF9120_01815 [Neisseria sp. oral taxon 020 str. F0370]
MDGVPFQTACAAKRAQYNKRLSESLSGVGAVFQTAFLCVLPVR